ncbi:MAG: peptidoglycan DD-metalloendopeptidase family protein [Candidatus Stygibacter frigidus]|nr:peptidoglycan DD-metalloendopeptidase family protein [Candidatus Stygibacter frigidus]
MSYLTKLNHKTLLKGGFTSAFFIVDIHYWFRLLHSQSDKDINVNIYYIIKMILICLIMTALSACRDNGAQDTKKIQFDFQNEQINDIDSTASADKDSPVTFLVDGEIPKGGTLANVLLKNDLNGNDVYNAVNSLNSLFNLRHVQPGDKFQVMTDSSGYIYELTFYRNPIKKYLVYRDSSGAMASKIAEEALTMNVKLIEGVLESSLYKTVLDAGEQPALAMQFTQIFQWDIDFFTDPRQGDKIKILFEEYTLNGEHARYGNILAASYISKSYEDTAYRFTDNKGSSKYYDEKGVCFQKAFLKSPLNFTRITSKFGRRVHPITKKTSMHNGVDYAAPYGTPVEAAADGVIQQARWNQGHTGNTVIIRHPNGYKTLYGHLSKYGKYKAGQKVKQHDVIGYVGSTGRSTGNHLHYTIYLNGKPIDPLKLKNVAGPPVSDSEMPAFKLNVQNLITQLNSEIEQDIVDEQVIAADSTEQEIFLPSEKEHLKLDTTILLIIIIAQFLLIIMLMIMLLLKRKHNQKIIE